MMTTKFLYLISISFVLLFRTCIHSQYINPNFGFFNGVNIPRATSNEITQINFVPTQFSTQFAATAPANGYQYPYSFTVPNHPRRSYNALTGRHSYPHAHHHRTQRYTPYGFGYSPRSPAFGYPPPLPPAPPQSFAYPQQFTPPSPYGPGRQFWHTPHRPHRHRYRDFLPVFHDLERKWERGNYDTNAEEHDMMDDFHGRSLVAPGQYPHMAAIGFRTSTGTWPRIVFQCGGSLISDFFVLTAAHCCNHNGQPPAMVKFGDVNLNRRDFDSVPQRRFVADYFLHPKYNSSMYYNDIALLQLSAPVEYTPFVRPIRLWAQAEIPYEKVFTMGYGSTSFAHAPTNILTELDLSIVPMESCSRQYPLSEDAPNGILESQICAQDFVKHRDTCQGDSGGPLQLNLERRRRRRRYKYYLVGIISYGDFCGSQHPGVYTRVSYYVDWIASIVWPEYYSNFMF